MWRRAAALGALLGACQFEPHGVAGGGPPDAAPSDGARPAPDAGPGEDAAVDDVDGATPPPDDAAPDGPDALPCPASHTAAFGGHRYLAAASPVEWAPAEDACLNQGSHLVVIDDAAENAFVRDLVPGGARLWIGMSDRVDEGTWRWVTAAPSGYRNWNGGEPNSGGGGWFPPDEDCVEMLADGRWNDLACDDLKALVCECDGAAADPGSFTPP